MQDRQPVTQPQPQSKRKRKPPPQPKKPLKRPSNKTKTPTSSECCFQVARGSSPGSLLSNNIAASNPSHLLLLGNPRLQPWVSLVCCIIGGFRVCVRGRGGLGVMVWVRRGI